MYRNKRSRKRKNPIAVLLYALVLCLLVLAVLVILDGNPHLLSELGLVRETTEEQAAEDMEEQSQTVTGQADAGAEGTDPASGESDAAGQTEAVDETEAAGETDLSEEEDSIYETVRAAVEQKQEQVSLPGVSKEDAFAAVRRIHREPEYFWVSDAVYYSSLLGLNSLELPMKYTDVEEKQAQVEAAADQIISGIPAEYGEYDKALYLHDWLCNHLTYGFSADGDGSDQDIYGALVKGQCVCGGYANAFAYLLRRVGINAEVILGTATNSEGVTEDHAWNLVTLEGDSYYFDVTWDDQEEALPDYAWFGLTSGQIEQSHTPTDPEVEPDTYAVNCNYYVRNGLVMSEYSDDFFLSLIVNQGPCVDFLCTDDQVLEQVQAVVGDPYKLGEIMVAAGYSVDNSYVFEVTPGIRAVRIIIS